MTRSIYFTVYHPDVPKGCTNRNFDVGPFRVHVSNKQHYRLYTAELAGVVFLKQASYPSIDQLCDDLDKAVSLHRIPRAVAAPYLKAAAPLRHPKSLSGIKVKHLPDMAMLLRKKNRGSKT